LVLGVKHPILNTATVSIQSSVRDKLTFSISNHALHLSNHHFLAI
jgi:hypothetical protein